MKIEYLGQLDAPPNASTQYSVGGKKLTAHLHILSRLRKQQFYIMIKGDTDLARALEIFLFFLRIPQ
jgi:hypothetical protein